TESLHSADECDEYFGVEDDSFWYIVTEEKAKEMLNKKYTVEDDIIDSFVDIVLTEDATKKVKSGEKTYSLDDFKDLGVSRIWSFSLNEAERSETYKKYQRQYSYTLYLETPGKQNVIDLIEKMNERDDILIAFPAPVPKPADSSDGNISIKTVKLKAGKTKKISTSKSTIKNWNSSDKKVAIVKNGKITALKKGSAIITATLKNGDKLISKVTVTSNPKLNKSKKSLKKGKTFTIKITGKVGKAKFTSNNKKVAKVNSKGKVTAKKKGKATITVKTNGMKLKCKITVK
ncbi:MAG: Ig-like domain-containing protein, partial [Ruminococcus sp.]|nr:Ig-like domain-containing protein [Ruminococcus sp.]